MNVFGPDIGAILSGLLGQPQKHPQLRHSDQIDAMFKNAFNGCYGPQVQQQMQGLGAQYGNQARNTMNLFSGVFGSLGPVMKHPTEREIAIAELKECLGEELWDLAPIS